MKSLKLMTVMAAFLIYSGTAAQDFTRHEYSITVGGGASGFQTRPTIGRNNGGWTGTAGLGYHYFFNPSWSIGSGANFAMYKGGMSINGYNQRQVTINSETGNTFEFSISTSKYREKQNALMITIPLMGQFLYQDAGPTAFYAALGAKVGIPLTAKSKSTGSFTTEGFFPNLDVTYKDLPDYGFVTNQSFPNKKTGVGLKTSFMLSAELGVKWSLGPMSSLYAGFYVDYGVNRVLDKVNADNTNIVVYQTDRPEVFNFNTAASLYARKAAPFAGGVTVRLAFSELLFKKN